MRFKLGLIPNLTSFIVLLMCFQFTVLDVSFENHKNVEEKGKCNSTHPVQMVKIKFSSHVVKNGKLTGLVFNHILLIKSFFLIYRIYSWI